MSKRARITLNLDPEPESESEMTKKPQAEPGDASAVEPKPRVKSEAKSTPRPVPAARPKRESLSGSERNTAKVQATDSKPGAASPTQARAAPGQSRVKTHGPAVAQPGSESNDSPAGTVKLGNIIKVALVGLVVVSAIFLLKRKP